jgi:hypothetical protein
VCSLHCKKIELLTLKRGEIERIFLQQILHALVTKALARFRLMVAVSLISRTGSYLYTSEPTPQKEGKRG